MASREIEKTEPSAADPPASSAARRDKREQASPELLTGVATRLRELELVAGGAAEELRRQAALTQKPASRARPDNVAGAVLYELMVTLSERANGLEHEAELIAGILERAREAITSPGAPRKVPPRSLPGRMRLATESPRRAKRNRGSVEGQSGRPTDRESAPPPAARENGAPPRGSGFGPASAGVKLLAAQMALEGNDFAAIQERLETEFGVSDPASAVKEVLGRETGETGS